MGDIFWFVLLQKYFRYRRFLKTLLKALCSFLPATHPSDCVVFNDDF